MRLLSRVLSSFTSPVALELCVLMQSLFMSFKSSIWILVMVAISCNNNDHTNSDSDKIASMDTTNTKLSDRINGPAGTIYIDDGGNGDLPVVFLHSFGGSSTNWKNQLTELRLSRRAIAIDFRGHGKSDIPTGNEYSPDALASDVEAVVDSLKLGKFILVGHSMGGSAAIAYAGMYPNR